MSIPVSQMNEVDALREIVEQERLQVGTVSTAVQAAIDASGITGKTILVDSVNGNDSTGAIGTSKPFLTLQAAFNAALAASGNVLIKIGVGTFGNIAVPVGGLPSRIQFQGAGKELTTIGSITSTGAANIAGAAVTTALRDLTCSAINSTGGSTASGTIAGAGGAITLTLENVIVSGAIKSTGGGSTSTGHAGAGGNVSVTCVGATTLGNDVTANGGAQVEGSGTGNGGNAGTVTINVIGRQPTVVGYAVNSFGGDSDTGTPGNGGATTVFGVRTSEAISSAGGFNLSANHAGGNGGSVTAAECEATKIESVCGSGSADGTAGAVTVTKCAVTSLVGSTDPGETLKKGSVSITDCTLPSGVVVGTTVTIDRSLVGSITATDLTIHGTGYAAKTVSGTDNSTANGNFVITY